MLSKISKENREQEKAIFSKLSGYIDTWRNVVFNSGAGSGKTYALVEAIRYVINTKYRELEKYGQKIVCITYTNVAADEVRERLGNSSFVLVSTIHERLWSFIKHYNRELDLIHKERLEREIVTLQHKIEELKDISSIQEEIRSKILQFLQEHKSDYYRIRNLKASDFRASMKDFLGDLYEPLIFTSVSRFNNWISLSWKLEAYSRCVDKINTGKIERHAVYDPMNNNDHLDKMRFSHDTLLEYSLEMITKYPRLAQLISDSYPYFFIDEYQDTAEQVIRIVSRLNANAIEVGHHFWFGYFGDPVQSIYENGIGDCLEDKLCEEKVEYTVVEKPFNRRSTSNIINVGNKVRADNHLQKSIYEDSEGFEPRFYYMDESVDLDVQTDNFINKIKNDYSINDNNRLHCFVLTNEYLAKSLHIDNIWNYFKSLKYYQYGTGNAISTELLSHDRDKLGPVQKRIYNILHFLTYINTSSAFLDKIFPKEILKNLTFDDVFTLTSICKSFRRGTLYDSIKNMDEYCSNEYTGLVASRVKQMLLTFSDNNVSIYETLEREIIDIFYRDVEDNVTPKQEIAEFLNLSIDEFTLWFNHVERIESSSVVYHTYHGTKGLEYDNVLIIMDAKWGRDLKYFPNLFKSYGLEKGGDYKGARNLLYVAATRAKKHLIVLYRDSISGFEEEVSAIFPVIEKY